MELVIVNVEETDSAHSMTKIHDEIVTRQIDLPLFARSQFCVHFTLPLFEKTMPLQLSAVWTRHPLEPRAYPSGEQLMSHLEAISSGGGARCDPAVLSELCKHWTLCIITTWAQMTKRQLLTLQFEVSYLTCEHNLLFADWLNETLVFSDDISHLLTQRPDAGDRFVHVNQGLLFTIAIKKVQNKCEEYIPQNHLPNYTIHHHVKVDGNESTVYYSANSKTFQKHYESGKIIHKEGAYVKKPNADQLGKMHKPNQPERGAREKVRARVKERKAPGISRTSADGSLRIVEGKKSSSKDYIKHRCEKVIGMTVEQALLQSFPNVSGAIVRYRRSDLNYDIECGRLRLTQME